MTSAAMRSEFPVGGAKLVLVEGDITRVPADVIVNAANSRLAGGGGVDGAIHRAGGSEIMRELDRIRAEKGGCPTGDAVVTGAGKLPAKYVIHTVGPVYRDGRRGEADLLASCYRTSLRLAEERAAKTISFPSISTGVYSYPLAEAAEVAIGAVAEHLRGAECGIEEAVFVLFGKRAYEAHLAAARRILKD